MIATLNDNTYSHIRGFNYQPSYASNGLDSWIYRFDFETIRRELGCGKKLFPHINTIRLWLSPDAFAIDRENFCKNVDKVMTLADELDVKFIITLYNFWHAIPDFGGLSITHFSSLSRECYRREWRDYLKKIVGIYTNDKRILLWDLCNEPLVGPITEDGKTMVIEALQWFYDQCKDLDGKTPICVGAIPNMDAIERLEPLCDVLTVHPYFAYNGWVKTKQNYTDFLDQAVKFANIKNKPLISTETCWGSVDDQHRADIVEFELSEQANRGIGFVAHLLYESRVADAHRQDWGPVDSPGYMAFINRDGNVRPYHEIFNKF